MRIRTARGNAEMTDAEAAVQEAAVQRAAVQEAGGRGPGPAGAEPDPRSRFARTTSTTVTSLVRMAVRSPRLLPSVAVYVLVTVASRVLARRQGSAGWQRDASTR